MRDWILATAAFIYIIFFGFPLIDWALKYWRGVFGRKQRAREMRNESPVEEKKK